MGEVILMSDFQTKRARLQQLLKTMGESAKSIHEGMRALESSSREARNIAKDLNISAIYHSADEASKGITSMHPMLQNLEMMANNIPAAADTLPRNHEEVVRYNQATARLMAQIVKP